MKFLFLGTGSAFTVGDNFQSNMLLIADDGAVFLIDCGGDVRHSLHQHQYTHKAINNVYISHLHADHIGGMEWLGFSRKFDPTCRLPNLFISDDLVEPLWDHALSAGMRSLKESDSQLTSYFDVQSVAMDKRQFHWAGVEFTLVQTEHVYDNGKPVPCYGLFFTYQNTRIFLSTDSQYTPDRFSEYFSKADVIFHDCETGLFKSGVHAHFDELCQLPPAIKQKMWLYHYQPGTLPDAVKVGFKGFAQPGQVIDFDRL